MVQWLALVPSSLVRLAGPIFILLPASFFVSLFQVQCLSYMVDFLHPICDSFPLLFSSGTLRLSEYQSALHCSLGSSRHGRIRIFTRLWTMIVLAEAAVYFWSQARLFPLFYQSHAQRCYESPSLISLHCLVFSYVLRWHEQQA